MIDDRRDLASCRYAVRTQLERDVPCFALLRGWKSRQLAGLALRLGNVSNWRQIVDDLCCLDLTVYIAAVVFKRRVLVSVVGGPYPPETASDAATGL